jgi:hypothetical protein
LQAWLKTPDIRRLLLFALWLPVHSAIRLITANSAALDSIQGGLVAVGMAASA